MLFGAPFVQGYLQPLVFAAEGYSKSWEKLVMGLTGFSSSGSATHHVSAVETYRG